MDSGKKSLTIPFKYIYLQKNREINESIKIRSCGWGGLPGTVLNAVWKPSVGVRNWQNQWNSFSTGRKQSLASAHSTLHPAVPKCHFNAASERQVNLHTLTHSTAWEKPRGPEQKARISQKKKKRATSFHQQSFTGSKPESSDLVDTEYNQARINLIVFNIKMIAMLINWTSDTLLKKACLNTTAYIFSKWRKYNFFSLYIYIHHQVRLLLWK